MISYKLYKERLDTGYYKFPTHYNLFYEALRIFGKDRVDYKFKPLNIYSKKFYHLMDITEDPFAVSRKYYELYPNNYIMIYYPELLLQNSSGEQHTLLDLFVKISIKWGVVDQLSLWRATFTYNECLNHYVFSHLNSRNISELKSFNSSLCFGNSAIIPLLTNLQNSQFSQDTHIFYAILTKYLSWESLEGGPYHRISKLKHTGLTPAYSHRYTDSLNPKRREHLDRLLSKGLPLHIAVKKLYAKYPYKVNTGYYWDKVEREMVKRYNLTKKQFPDNSIIFNGKVFRQKVISIPTPSIGDRFILCHIGLMRTVQSILEQHKKCYTNYITQKLTYEN